MEYTNKHNLPQIIFDKIAKGWYVKAGGYSASQLGNPVRQIILSERHGDKLEKDVSEQLLAMLGTGFHELMETRKHTTKYMYNAYKKILDECRTETEGIVQLSELMEEMAKEYFLVPVDVKDLPEVIQEYRFMTRMAGVEVTGKNDYMNKTERVIKDYKVTSAYKVLKGDIEDWTFQQNVYRYLAWCNGIEVDKLQIIALIRDWSKTDATINPDYPQVPMKVIDLPVWGLEETAQIILDKIIAIGKAKKLSDEDLPLCTDKERWAAPPIYGAFKEGNTRNSKNFDSHAELKAYILANADKGYVERITPGKSIKCESYCEVRHLCSQRNGKSVEVVEVVLPEIAAVPLEDLDLELDAFDIQDKSTEDLWTEAKKAGKPEVPIVVTPEPADDFDIDLDDDDIDFEFPAPKEQPPTAKDLPLKTVAPASPAPADDLSGLLIDLDDMLGL